MSVSATPPSVAIADVSSVGLSKFARSIKMVGVASDNLEKSTKTKMNGGYQNYDHTCIPHRELTHPFDHMISYSSALHQLYNAEYFHKATNTMTVHVHVFH